MDLLLGLGFATLAWVAGSVVFSFFFIQPLIIVRMGIPATRYLEGKGLLIPDNPVHKQHVLALLVQVGILISTLSLVAVLFTSQLLFFAIGAGIVTVMGLRRTGWTDSNIRDYLESNARYFVNMDDVARALVSHASGL